MKVPFLDLKAQHDSIRGEIDEAIHMVIESSAFAGGPFVERFEQEFAAFCGRRYAIGVGSGTDALWLALLAMGIGTGDEVITVPNSFFATVEAILWCGAKPVFIDVNPDTYTMDPALLAQAISPRTKAVIPVHLYGQVAEMDPIIETARAHGLFILEDACQAHGASYKGKIAGSFGHAAAFSFYPGKNLGAMGEAGAVVTDDEAIARSARMLRDHGQSRKYYHDAVGCNGRMDGIQGAVLSVKLRHLNAWNDARRRKALLYNEKLAGLQGVLRLIALECGLPNYHIYAVLTDRRDALIQKLQEKNIGYGIHYPVPLHLQQATSQLGYKKGTFPVAERCANETLSLPMFAELSADQIEQVSATIREHVEERSADAAPATPLKRRA